MSNEELGVIYSRVELDLRRFNDQIREVERRLKTIGDQWDRVTLGGRGAGSGGGGSSSGGGRSGGFGPSHAPRGSTDSRDSLLYQQSAAWNREEDRRARAEQTAHARRLAAAKSLDAQRSAAFNSAARAEEAAARKSLSEQDRARKKLDEQRQAASRKAFEAEQAALRRTLDAEAKARKSLDAQRIAAAGKAWDAETAAARKSLSEQDRARKKLDEQRQAASRKAFEADAKGAEEAARRRLAAERLLLAQRGRAWEASERRRETMEAAAERRRLAAAKSLDAQRGRAWEASERRRETMEAAAERRRLQAGTALDRQRSRAFVAGEDRRDDARRDLGQMASQGAMRFGVAGARASVDALQTGASFDDWVRYAMVNYSQAQRKPVTDRQISGISQRLLGFSQKYSRQIRATPDELAEALYSITSTDQFANVFMAEDDPSTNNPWRMLKMAGMAATAAKSSPRAALRPISGAVAQGIRGAETPERAANTIFKAVSIGQIDYDQLGGIGRVFGLGKDTGATLPDVMSSIAHISSRNPDQAHYVITILQNMLKDILQPQMRSRYAMDDLSTTADGRKLPSLYGAGAIGRFGGIGGWMTEFQKRLRAYEASGRKDIRTGKTSGMTFDTVEDLKADIFPNVRAYQALRISADEETSATVKPYSYYREQLRNTDGSLDIAASQMAGGPGAQLSSVANSMTRIKVALSGGTIGALEKFTGWIETVSGKVMGLTKDQQATAGATVMAGSGALIAGGAIGNSLLGLKALFDMLKDARLAASTGKVGIVLTSLRVALVGLATNPAILALIALLSAPKVKSLTEQSLKAEEQKRLALDPGSAAGRLAQVNQLLAVPAMSSAQRNAAFQDVGRRMHGRQASNFDREYRDALMNGLSDAQVQDLMRERGALSRSVRARRGDPRLRTTTYGQTDDPTGDSLTRAGIGGWNNRLRPATKAGLGSVAIRQADADRLMREGGLKRGGRIGARLPDGRIEWGTYDDTLPPFGTGMFDVYDPRNLRPDMKGQRITGLVTPQMVAQGQGTAYSAIYGAAPAKTPSSTPRSGPYSYGPRPPTAGEMRKRERAQAGAARGAMAPGEARDRFRVEQRYQERLDAGVDPATAAQERSTGMAEIAARYARLNATLDKQFDAAFKRIYDRRVKALNDLRTRIGKWQQGEGARQAIQKASIDDYEAMKQALGPNWNLDAYMAMERERMREGMAGLPAGANLATTRVGLRAGEYEDIKGKELRERWGDFGDQLADAQRDWKALQKYQRETARDEKRQRLYVGAPSSAERARIDADLQYEEDTTEHGLHPWFAGARRQATLQRIGADTDRDVARAERDVTRQRRREEYAQRGPNRGEQARFDIEEEYQLNIEGGMDPRVAAVRRRGAMESLGRRESFEKVQEKMRALSATARNVQSTLSGVFEGFLTRGKSTFAQLTDAFKAMIIRMVAQAAAARITDYLFGKADERGDRRGGKLGNLFGLLPAVTGGKGSKDTGPGVPGVEAAGVPSTKGVPAPAPGFGGLASVLSGMGGKGGPATAMDKKKWDPSTIASFGSAIAGKSGKTRVMESVVKDGPGNRMPKPGSPEQLSGILGMLQAGQGSGDSLGALAGVAGMFMGGPWGMALRGFGALGGFKGIKKMFRFDDPANDGAARRWGYDFSRFFAQGAQAGAEAHGGGGLGRARMGSAAGNITIQHYGDVSNVTDVHRMHGDWAWQASRQLGIATPGR